MTARRGLPVLLLLVLAVMAAPRTRATDTLSGYASAYAPGVMEATIRYRLDYDVWRSPPPIDWYTAHGAIAVMDCDRVGEMTTLIDPAGRMYRVLIADCAGDDGPADRFSRDSIIVELDWRLWERLTAAHGRPLEVGLTP